MVQSARTEEVDRDPETVCRQVLEGYVAGLLGPVLADIVALESKVQQAQQQLVAMNRQLEQLDHSLEMLAVHVATRGDPVTR
ncbi:MAG: hypothetical protein PHC60_03525 [Heliobacteriaceae bacterium]|nr:hypothetical protein [Heliobacteriaceae bacterium]